MAKTQIDWSKIWLQYESWIGRRWPSVRYTTILSDEVCQKIQDLVEAQLDGPLFTPEEERFCENIDSLSKSNCALPSYDVKDFLNQKGRDLYARWKTVHAAKDTEADDDA